MTEAAIQSSIKNQLTKNGWFVTKLIQTSTPGIADMLSIKNKKVVFIEVKRPGNNPTDLQAYRIKQLTEQGIECIVAYSTKDIKHLID